MELRSSKPTANPPKGDGEKGSGVSSQNDSKRAGDSGDTASAPPGREFAVTHKGREK